MLEKSSGQPQRIKQIGGLTPKERRLDALDARCIRVARFAGRAAHTGRSCRAAGWGYEGGDECTGSSGLDFGIVLEERIDQLARERLEAADLAGPVSYTHLTLPTILRV